MNTGGFTTQISPDACQVAINTAMYEEFNREQNPGYVRASNSTFFKQDRTELISFIWDEDSNVGEFDKTGEQEEIKNTDSFVGNTKTKRSQKYTKQVPVSDEAFRSDKIGKRNNIGKNIGDRARMTQDKSTLLDTYGDAFAGSLNTTPDSQPLASNSHITVKGFTVDNLETMTLTPDGAWTLNNSLASQKGQDGDPGGQVLAAALCPFILYKTMKEVMNSSLIANSAENNLNIFDTDYGAIEIGASIYLNSTYNSNSNANTSYHFVSDNHMITRMVFYDLVSKLIAPEFSDNDTYTMRTKFHEAHLIGSWTGYAGSNGTTTS